MAYSWKQIERRALKFSKEWKDAAYEKGETQSFYNDFFDIFGVKRRSVARYEECVKKLSGETGFIDLFWPGVLIVEQKSKGKDLAKAEKQAGDYFDALKEEEKPRYQLVCDFQTFRLTDRDDLTKLEFKLGDLHKHVERFAFITGKQPPKYRVREPIDIRASKYIAKIYKGLEKAGYGGDDLEVLLTRLVFCLFADNTGIFQPRNTFLDLIESRTAKDGSDLGLWLCHLFQVLDKPVEKRAKGLDKDLAQYPYIDGGLFKGRIEIPSFSGSLRKDLLAACEFDWSQISPAIWGSLFQLVLSKKMQTSLGGYGTTETNILKLINDLFLNELKAEFNAIKTQKRNKATALKKFRKKLSELRFLDPACGCGNFIAVTYQELRRLELEILKELKKLGKLKTNADKASIINVDQFFGIEFRSYSAQIARTVMWMVDHVANVALSLELDTDFHRVPLLKTSKIVVGDALDLSWSRLLAPSKCDYVFGNPPYTGSKKQSDQQREQVKKLSGIKPTGGTLDYACGWVLKAAKYAKEKTPIGFIITNSVTQGEQVPQLWPILYNKYDREISFAHQSFRWTSWDTGGPQVQVVILGLENKANKQERRLYTYETASSDPVLRKCKTISPYLVAGDKLENHHTFVIETTTPINGLGKLKTGTKPIDGGYYVFETESEKKTFLKREPKAAKIIHPYIGTEELLGGTTRYLLVPNEASVSEIRRMSEVKKVIGKVRKWRNGEILDKAKKKKRGNSRELSDRPQDFHLTEIPTKDFLVVPEVTSERREYLTCARFAPPIIPSNLVKYSENGTLVQFGLLISKMLMSWLVNIGGKLEGRNRFSLGIVYNNFPIAEMNATNRKAVESGAKGVLKARESHPGASLRDLYDVDSMPSNLKKAHNKLDDVVDKIYLGKPKASDEERIVNLLNRYHRMVSS